VLGLLLGTWCMPARGDGGSVCLSEKTGPYQVTVFSAPTPLRAGPVDISVLVQDAATGQPMPQATVTISMTQIGQPALANPATQDIATNKLLHAARFELPVPGRWELKVHVDGAKGLVVVGLELEVSPPLPRWRELWPWFAWPALAVGLFGVHHLL